MKEGMQKMSPVSVSCPQISRPEAKGYAGVQTFMRVAAGCLTTEQPSRYPLLEQILSPSNLNAAYRQVMRNKGAAGMDKMSCERLLGYLLEHNDALTESIRQRTYRPNPVRRVEIPKDNGKNRLLGIPTVVDRMIQQAIAQVLTPIYERQFSDGSYGFRPSRGAKQALVRVTEIVGQGYRYAVGIDLERFFDTVNHSKLIEILQRTIKDDAVISLIHRYLNAGVMIGTKVEPTREGTPQGGPLSPLLANVLLNELDKELERRCHPFVRYADDGLIFCKSRRAAERVRDSIAMFIEKDLKLKVNREKTECAYIGRLKYLGYGFYVRDGKCRLRLHEKSEAKLRRKLKQITSRSNGMGYEQRKTALHNFLKGWTEYFSYADMGSKAKDIDQWLRRRLRMCIWKSWKQPRTRVKNLIKCGIDKRWAYQWGNTSKGYWRIAGSWILARAIGDEALCKAGYSWIGSYYSASALPKG
ncbi:MAG: group II intron reverse transcriptase/maturase [Prevotella sp.]|nr:group II intron reverse transcriptase/maturase [Prevotella sp.]